MSARRTFFNQTGESVNMTINNGEVLAAPTRDASFYPSTRQAKAPVLDEKFLDALTQSFALDRAEAPAGQPNVSGHNRGGSLRARAMQ